jgi:hypothetical protein
MFSLHGFAHLLRMQDNELGHSEFVKHSGLQFGGVPIISDRHVQTG